ncbi:hypothetical protein CLM62_48365 [Streptomyces sp. SA15]|nr:hypothetical protein CLM62_48365 [Streptomyces sp. SA15]
MWHRDRLRWDAMEQALAAVESKVADRWYSSLLKAVDAMATHLGSFRKGPEREVARQRILTLMMQLDRTMYFTVVREAPTTTTSSSTHWPTSGGRRWDRQPSEPIGDDHTLCLHGRWLRAVVGG